MDKLRVAVLGASGIGKFHCREFKNAGCDVVAILGSTEESSKATSSNLEREFKVKLKEHDEQQKANLDKRKAELIEELRKKASALLS